MRALVFVVAIVACKSPQAVEDAGLMGVPANVMPDPFAAPALPMPSDWPLDVPIYPNAHLSKAETHPFGALDGGRKRALEFEVRDDIAKVVVFYSDAFAKLTKPYDVNMGMVHALHWDELGSRREIDLTVTAVGNVTQVTLSVSTR